MENLTSKQRAFLMSLASKEKASIRIGKEELTPEVTEAVIEILEARELVKIGVEKNCFADLKELGRTLAERTRSNLVQVIGRKIVLYKQAKDPQDRTIRLPLK